MLKKLVAFGSLFVLACFTIFVINQTAQVVSLTNTFSPLLGRIVLGGLLIIYAVAILVPITLFIRLPKPLGSPPADDSPEYDIYLSRLRTRLDANPNCADVLNEDADKGKDRELIDSAITVLDAKADDIIQNTARKLFVATAISQSGRLDGLMVLVSQTRMIWQIARIYNQRPTLRDLGWLYANVGASVFVASELEDIDLHAQIQPVIQVAGGKLIAGHLADKFVPGVGKLASIVVDQILVGTANAYLTLRVGIVCRNYCGWTAVDRRKARRNASLGAAKMLGQIVTKSSATVVRNITDAIRKAAGVDPVLERIRDAWDKIFQKSNA